MSNRNLSKAIQGLSQEISKLCRSMTKQVINWLLRAAFVIHRPGSSSSGFVLPTTVLLILVVSLSVGALTYRAFTRNTQVITQNQQRVIYNAATPAIDRARSKLEFMFDQSKDERYPSGGIPLEEKLLGIFLNDGSYGVPSSLKKDAAGNSYNQYLLPDETPVNLDNTPTGTAEKPVKSDAAWSFKTDMDGDGKIDATVVYSIIFRTPAPVAGSNFQKELVKMSDKQKERAQVVRHGPLTTATGSACNVSSASLSNQSDGWFEDPSNTSVVRKNFQVDVLVIPDSPKVAAVTLEFQQDREISKGNKWAAWFRNDLEIFPGPRFRWNGAVHTEGNLIVGDGNKFQAHLISSTESCLYPPIENSEITVTNVTNPAVEGDFAGTIAVGKMGTEDKDPSFSVHNQLTPKTAVNIKRSNSSMPATSKLDNIYSDPVAILLEDKRRTASSVDPTNRKNVEWGKLPSTVTTDNPRLRQNFEPTPSIDDLYRADDRWGPKPKYDNKLPAVKGDLPPGRSPARKDSDKTGFGYQIPADDDKVKYLITNNTSGLKAPITALDKADTEVGYDGYWERRARNEGLRVIVGERLELGNLFGWKMPHEVGTADDYIDPSTEEEGDPLYPPEVKPYPVRKGQFLTHLNMQRRTLRDNLSAVQATAVYHTDIASDYPVACLASTSHAGTPTTLRDSINFVPTQFLGEKKKEFSLMSDFFMGRGTNGWEFEPPQNTPENFKNSLVKGAPLRNALDNLAHLAGDPKGAFPPVQEDGVMHPYPGLTMWGNFSNLRRALDLYDSKGDYDGLSIADKTYIQTASCTLGMIAYEIDMVQKFEPTENDGSRGVLKELGQDIYQLMDGDREDNNQEDGGEVLPDSQMKRYFYKRGGPQDTGNAYEPRDYYDVPPEAYIAALRQKYTMSKDMDVVGNNEKLRLAEMIMLKYQIRRDRTFGFRPSPSFGHYAVTREGKNQIEVFPSACDPNELFGLNIDTDPRKDLARQRLGLSRLCGALNIPYGYNLSDASSPPVARPVVMPKFPALYYLFPVQEHNLNGSLPGNSNVGAPTKVPTLPNEYNTRQPDGGLTIEERKDMLFTDEKFIADEKFIEPYVVDVNNVAIVGSNVFKPVQPEASVTKLKPDEPSLYYYSATMANADKIAKMYDFSGVLPISGATVDDWSKYKAAAFPAINRSPFPLKETSVSGVVVNPRRLNGYPATGEDWKLPRTTNVLGTGTKINTPTNIIIVPGAGNRGSIKQVPYAVPFLDRAIYDARELMLTRVLDMDLGLMRSESIVGGKFQEPLLPMSGIVYAFREDSVREDGIARPAATVGKKYMSAIDPSKPVDPPIDMTSPGRVGISTKPVDYLPDPERRVHGFRLRNGAQIKRNDKFEKLDTSGATNNYRGLSIFTDQPLYIQGDMNLHQSGADDSGPNESMEEFKGAPGALIRGQEFADNAGGDTAFANRFYDRGTAGKGVKNGDFAQSNVDRWRPTELLADSITILSENFCDGSASDEFVSYDNKDYSKGQQHIFANKDENRTEDSFRGIYHDRNSGFTKTGLYSVGCSTKEANQERNERGYSSFRNSDQPITSMEAFDWVRENPYPTSYSDALRIDYDRDKNKSNNAPAGDYMTPIKISRSGLPVLREPLKSSVACNTEEKVASGTKQICNPLSDTRLYSDRNDTKTPSVSAMRFRYIGEHEDGKNRVAIRGNNRATKAIINSIVVSGIPPSRIGQSYGGLQNFPRFVENWDRQILDYAGSFLQLSFSNYATAPWEVEAWEYDSAGKLDYKLDDTKENLPFYRAPLRTWGYDVALQLAPAGPAASRFVIPRSSRNEFYTEPQINDPYIQTLCRAAKDVKIKGSDSLNCTN